MNKDPAIIFYTSDFMMGTSNLTMEERGQYITLLCLQHQLGHLSKKTIELNVKNISKDVLGKFTLDDDGNYYNERLEYEINKRTKFIEHQVENGKKGGRPKTQIKPKQNPNKTQTETQIKAKEKPLENENEIENRNINNNKFIKPTIEEINEYCLERKNGIDAESFYNFYESKGWKVGNQPMKNWKACIITWEKRNNKKQEILPDWFDKDLKNEELGDDDKLEMDNQLNEIFNKLNNL